MQARRKSGIMPVALGAPSIAENGASNGYSYKFELKKGFWSIKGHYRKVFCKKYVLRKEHKKNIQV